MPEVSVIIPCYRAEAFIERPVRSLLSQTFTDWEAVLVSDDGVDYAEVLAAQGIHDVRLKFATTNQVRSGCGNPRNVGLAQASAPIIACLDADDSFMPTYLEYMLPLAREHGFAVANAIYIDEATSLTLPQLAADTLCGARAYIDDVPSRILRPGCAAVVYNKQRIPSQWHTQTTIAEDILFLLQAYEYVPYIYSAEQALYCYYRRDGSVTRSMAEIEQFVAQKERLIEAIESGDIFAHRPEIGAIAARYFRCSLDAERDYVQHLKIDALAEFPIFLARHFFEAGLIQTKA